MTEETPLVPERSEFKIKAARSMARLAIDSLERAMEAKTTGKMADWLYDASTRTMQAIEILEAD